MNTRKLIDYVENLGEVLTSDDSERYAIRKEIIGRLKEYNEYGELEAQYIDIVLDLYEQLEEKMDAPKSNAVDK